MCMLIALLNYYAIINKNDDGAKFQIKKKIFYPGLINGNLNLTQTIISFNLFGYHNSNYNFF